MKGLIKQFGGLVGAGVAAACCLGIPVVLSALGAAGMGFLIHDAYLFPIFVAFIAFALWTLYRSSRSHRNLAPFWVGLAGGVLSAIGLFLLVTGLQPVPWTIYAGLGVFLAGSIWDIVPGRKPVICACEVPAAKAKATLSRRAVNGAALSVAAAATFYGIYRTVAALAPQAKEKDIACWGINSCKGTTACTTAFNSCTRQNSCKGHGYLYVPPKECAARGYLYVPPKECAARGGVPLEGSPADPARKQG